MKFQIKLLTMAVAVAASASSFAASTTVSRPGDDLGLLSEFPSQFLDYRLTDVQGRFAAAAVPPEGILFGHTYSFTLGTESSIIGSLAGFLGEPAFSSVSVVPDAIGGTTLTQSFDYAPGGSFRFDNLAAGTYTLLVDVIYPSGAQGYAGSVYATAPAVPEPQSLALLLAGLGVAGVVVRRRANANQA